MQIHVGAELLKYSTYGFITDIWALDKESQSKGSRSNCHVFASILERDVTKFYQINANKLLTYLT